MLVQNKYGLKRILFVSLDFRPCFGLHFSQKERAIDSVKTRKNEL